MTEPQQFLEHILKKFPYAGKPDQFQRIATYINAKAGGNAKQVREQAEISDPTRRKIEAAWNDLTLQERGYLLNQIGTEFLTAQPDNQPSRGKSR